VTGAPQPGGICTLPRLVSGSGLEASFLPTMPGSYKVEVTADDGCSVFRDAVVLDVRCPDVPAGAPTVVPLSSAAVLQSSFNGEKASYRAPPGLRPVAPRVRPWQ